MCGFTGAISLNSIDRKNVQEANGIIDCRGPDAKCNVEKKLKSFNINFWFNRLSILDLSNEANQPMYSKEFKTMIMFNGEIFNHIELRRELSQKGLNFYTSHSDTETILVGLSYFGIEFVNKLRGQFAIVFLDEKNSKLYFIRDRLGQKPLYYYFDKENIYFGSSLLSVLKISKKYDIDEIQLFNYLNYGIISSPNTIFKNIYKLKPSEIIKIDLQNDDFITTKSNYWNIENFIDNKPFNVEDFHNLFSEAVNLRISADVPVANFLSGGLDSTSIVKKLVDNGRSVNSFSVYFQDKKYDESIFINQVVNKYNLNHNFSTISKKIDIKDIDQALNSMDEPYSDPSVLPSFIISNQIGKHFKVAISGDGGDELLGGYERTMQSIDRSNLFSNLISKTYNFYPPFLGTGNRLLSKSNNLEIKYRSFLEDKKLLNLLKVNSSEYSFADGLNYEDDNYYKKLLAADYKYFLPEMMMYKIDRTSMANSLEVRSPFVDHKLIEYVISTDNSYFNPSNSKEILKTYLSNDFSNQFLSRKKQGFVFNVEKWVFDNLNLINENISNGYVLNNLNKNIINLLSINKSRINGQRIWKIFVLENYLIRTLSKSL